MGCLYIAHYIYSDKNTPHLLGVVMLYLLLEASAPTTPPLWSTDCSPCSLLPLQSELGRPPQHSTVSKCVSIFALSYFLALCLWGLFYWQLMRSSREKDCLNHLFYLYQHNYIENAKNKKMLVEVNGWTNSSKIPHLSHTVKKWYKCTFP